MQYNMVFKMDISSEKPSSISLMVRLQVEPQSSFKSTPSIKLVNLSKQL